MAPGVSEKEVDRLRPVVGYPNQSPGSQRYDSLRFVEQSAPEIFAEAEGLLGFHLRSEHVNDIRRETGLTLCGAGATPCPG
jgi:hypothetical protein